MNVYSADNIFWDFVFLFVELSPIDLVFVFLNTLLSRFTDSPLTVKISQQYTRVYNNIVSLT